MRGRKNYDTGSNSYQYRQTMSFSLQGVNSYIRSSAMRNWARPIAGMGSMLAKMPGGRFKFPLLAVVAGAAAIGGYYGYQKYTHTAFYKARKPINVKLRSYHEMNEYRRSMKEGYVKTYPYEDAERKFDALVEAITVNDVEKVADYVEYLFYEKGYVDEISRDQLIAYAANHTKVDVLDYFSKVFGEDVVRENTFAEHILDSSEEQKRQLTHYAEQFYQSPGKIKNDGFRLWTEYQKVVILQDNIDYAGYFPVLMGDPELDMLELMKEREVKAAIVADVTERLDNTVIIDDDEHPQCQEQYVAHLKDLKRQVLEKGRPVVGTQQLTGTHFTGGQVLAYPLEDGGVGAKVIFIDPLGPSEYGIFATYYHTYAALPYQVFDKVDEYPSVEKLQTRKNGCSIFTGYMYARLINADHILRANTQYGYKSTESNLLFKYVEQQDRPLFIFGFDYDHESELYKSTGTYKYVRMPVFVIGDHRQSYGKTKEQVQELEKRGRQYDASGSGVIHDARMFTYTPVAGGYAEEIVELGDVEEPGHYGLATDHWKSDPKRQQEYKKPVDIKTSDSVDKRIDRHTLFGKHRGIMKPMNKKNDQVPYDMGWEVAHYIVETDRFKHN